MTSIDHAAKATAQIDTSYNFRIHQAVLVLYELARNEGSASMRVNAHAISP